VGSPPHFSKRHGWYGRSLNVPGTKLAPWSITNRRSEVSVEVEFPREYLVARKSISKSGVLMKRDRHSPFGTYKLLTKTFVCFHMAVSVVWSTESLSTVMYSFSKSTASRRRNAPVIPRAR
jgi:hypothetical protein